MITAHAPRHGGHDNERGAIALITGVVMSLVLIVIAAIAIDLGTQRSVRRDMQALADIVALDVAHLVDGRSRGEIELGNGSTPSLADALAASVANNDTTTLGDGVDCGANGYATDAVVASPDGTSCVYAYLVKLLDDPAADPPYATNAAGRPQNVDASTAPDGVVVVTNSTVDFAFGVASSGSATRQAVAAGSSAPPPDSPEYEESQSACFEMGSFAAALDLGDSILAPLADWLDLETELDLIHYQNLAGADVSLADIAASPSIGSSTALLAPSGVTVGQLIDATIYALKNDPDSPSTDTSADVVALNALKVALGVTVDATVVVADAVKIDAGDDAALFSEINVLELLGTSIGMATGDHFLEVPLNIPDIDALGLTGLNLEITAIEGPRRACGHPNSAEASLTQSQITVEATGVGISENVLGVDLGVGPVSVSGGVGNAQAQLVAPPAIECGEGTAADPDTYSVDVASSVLGVNLDVPVTANGTINVFDELGSSLLNYLIDLLGLLGIPIDVEVVFDNVDLHLGAVSSGSDPNGTANLEVPGNVRGDGVPVTLGSAAPSVSPIDLYGSSGTVTVRVRTLLGGWDAITISLDQLQDDAVVNLALGLLFGTLQGALDGVVDLVNNELEVISALVGLHGSGADIFSVARPECGPPRLID